MAQTRHKRRQVLVDPDLQVGMSMYIVGWLYFYVVVFALLANAPAILAVLTAESGEAAYVEAVQRLRGFTRYTVFPLALTFVAMAVHGVFITHRVAGPVYRLKKTLRELAQRQVADTVHLRKKDYFKDLAVELNTALDSVREDAARRRRLNRDTVDRARELVNLLEEGGPEALDRALAAAHTTLDAAERLDRHLETSAPLANAVEDRPVPAASADARG